MNCPIIVGTDLTEVSADALIQAEARAQRDGAPLVVVHATSRLPWASGSEVLETELLHRLMREQVKRLTGRPEAQYSTIVERGMAHGVLERVASSHGGLLVVGGHEHAGIGHALLKDVAERAVAHARGPVLVARKHASSGRLLVAVDQPFHAAGNVLDLAVDEGRRSACRLTVLHCIGRGFLETLAADLLNGGAYARNPLGVSAHSTAIYQALRAEVQQRKMNADLRLVDGDPEVVIAEVARELRAELVILGASAGQGRTTRVTTAVLRNADCSVLVAPGQSQALRQDAPLHAGSS